MHHNLTQSQILSLYSRNRRNLEAQQHELNMGLLAMEYGELLITPEGWHPARFRAALKQCVPHTEIQR